MLIRAQDIPIEKRRPALIQYRKQLRQFLRQNPQDPTLLSELARVNGILNP